MISSGENLVSQMKLLLESMESQKLSLALISTSNEGQAYGQLVLQRQHSSEKRVVSKYVKYLYPYILCTVLNENNFFHLIFMLNV